MQTVIVIDTDDPQGIIDTIAILHNLACRLTSIDIHLTK